jgi:Pyruvate/2-oxoacid:ferredoxin oxidoreductase delta subunit
MKAEIIGEKCPAQYNLCQPLKQCPLKAIIYEEDINEPLGARIVIDDKVCNGCGICVDLCCGQAIIIRD